MRHLYSILLFLLPLVSVGQNLVPNPSFEEHTECPNSNGSIQSVSHWEKVGGDGGMNLYHECGYNGYGVPVNKGGGGYANSGQAYVDIILWLNNDLIDQNYEGNFLGAPLTSALDSGALYTVALYVSLWDSMNYAVNNLGICLTQGQPNGDISSLLSLTPQVVNQSGYLEDKLSWVLVESNFIADGGEDYITIGNFEGHDNTTAFYVGGGGVPPSHSLHYWAHAYYFIDDVSVVKDTTYHLSIQESNFQFSIYPNPATDNLRIESQTPLAQVNLIDLAGRPSIQQTFRQGQGDVSIDVSSLPSGIYLLEAITKDGRRSVQKVVVD